MFYYEILWAHEVSLMDPKIPNMENLHRLPARKGSAARLKAGQVLRVINTHVSQVVDFWAFNDPDLGECMSWSTIEYCLETVAAQQNKKNQQSGYPQCYPQSDGRRSVRFMTDKPTDPFSGALRPTQSWERLNAQASEIRAQDWAADLKQ